MRVREGLDRQQVRPRRMAEIELGSHPKLSIIRGASNPRYDERRQCSMNEVRLTLTPSEWQENRRMRADGKNLDYLWIYEPTKLAEGERRKFRYEIVPFGNAIEPNERER